ncbi:superoxide dismutase [Shouchella clausii]
MDSHEQALRKWKDELARLWKEQESEFVRSIGEEQTQPFTKSLSQLEYALEHDPTQANEHAQHAYDSWVVMADLRGKGKNNSVPIGGHRLPPMPYSYNALEPYIDEKTMRLHHLKHHQTYVNDLNKAEKEMEKARRTGNYDLIKHWEREAAFNGAGHYLHTLFWHVMSPNGGGEPQGALKARITEDFGSFQKMKAHFSYAAEKVEGGGWAMLIYAPRSHRLEILQAEKHQNLSQQDQVPLLVLDVWEHAYYLKYQNERKAYIEAWWNVVNWKEAENRYRQASQLKWVPY